MTHLSPREREIVLLVGRDGKRWGTVAREMGVKIGTVRSYVARILYKAKSDRSPREAMVEIYYRELVHAAADNGDGHTE